MRGLKLLVGPTSVTPGCMSCRLYQEVGDSSSLLMYQQWESEEALEDHLRSVNCRRLLDVMEAAGGAPEIRFDTVECSRGLELIESVRLKDTTSPVGEA